VKARGGKKPSWECRITTTVGNRLPFSKAFPWKKDPRELGFTEFQLGKESRSEQGHRIVSEIRITGEGGD